MPETEDRLPERFRLMVVPGVTVSKWSRVWAERLPDVELELVTAESAEAEGALPTLADAGLLRLPVDQESFHAIPLYTEATVVVVGKEHLLAEAGEVTLADLAEETLVLPLDDVIGWAEPPLAVADHRPATTAAAVELVAADFGVLIVPQSLARLHHRRDVTYQVVTDAPTSSVGFVWLRDRQTDLVEEMIGIIRGRTANSTRGRGAAEQPAQKQPAQKQSTQRQAQKRPVPKAKGRPGKRR